MIMINSEPYNKFLNKRTGISQNYIMTEIKEELINTYEFKMNKNDDNINSWSSRKSDSILMETEFREAIKFMKNK
jgi:hypothetical protein